MAHASSTQRSQPFRGVDEVLDLVHGVDAILTRRDIPTDTFSFVSEHAETLLGHPLRRWLEEPGFWLSHIVEPRERGRVESLLDEALERGGRAVLEYRARHADGRPIWLREHVQVMRSAEGTVARGVIIDVTEERRAVAVAERSYRSLELLKDVADEANDAETGVDAVRATLPRLTRFLGMTLGHAYLRDPDDARLVPLPVWESRDDGDLDAFREATADLSLRFTEGLVGRAAAAGEPLWMEDVTRAPQFRRADAARAAGLRCGVAVPVLAGERTAAVLEFFSRSECPQDDELLELLFAVGTTLGRAFEREWAERERRSRELRLREAQITARLGGWVWDADRDAIVLSDELRDVLGLEPGRTRLGADDLLERIHPDDRDAARHALRSALHEGRPFERELRLRRGEDEVHLHVHARVATAARGARRLSGTAQDVTERRKAEATERELVAERRARQHAEAVQARLVRTAGALARSNRQLDEFAYIASHDLKAPLRGIANLVRYLEEDLEDRLTDETREFMELLQTRVRWMQDLIDGILKFSRAGRESVPAERVDIAAMIGEVVDMLPPGPAVSVDVAPDASSLRSPVAPLRQVLLNLISNAFRFADAQSPHVAITVTRDDDPDLVRIGVRDNGQGIAKEFQDRIWVIFQTLQARDDGGGSGIGLAVVRKLVEQHGGEAWIESEPGEGATFLFTWPHDYQEEEEPHR